MGLFGLAELAIKIPLEDDTYHQSFEKRLPRMCVAGGRLRRTSEEVQFLGLSSIASRSISRVFSSQVSKIKIACPHKSAEARNNQS